MAEDGDQIGYVQRAKWGEYEAVCTVARCGWRMSQGNRSRQVAEGHLRGHATLVYPPRIPVYRTPPAGSDEGSES